MDLEAAAPQDDALSRSLNALAHPSRLALLRQLRTPRTLREITLRAGAAPGAGEEARSISRQAVREHLDRLIAIGVVHARETERDYGETTEYSLNHQALYALSEEFRGLARLRPASEPISATVARPTATPGPAPAGPGLVLVKGLDEGRFFPLAVGQGKQWTIGRRRGLEVSLDFDPFVSTENALVTWDGSAFLIEDLPDSRNGTMVNFVALAKGERRPLRSADVVGVGRSLLVFRASP